MHRLLGRQVAKASKDDAPLDIELLLALVSSSYDAWDRDRSLSERSFRLVEAELSEANRLTQASAEDHVRTILGRISDGVVIVTSDGRIKEVNGVICDWFRCKREEIIGVAVDDIFSVDSVLTACELPNTRIVNLMADASTSRQSLVLRGREHRRTDKVFETSVGLLDTRNSGEMLCILRDIAKQLATESALRAAKEAAESAVEAKSMFLATMSHEIRTPLNGVIGLIESLIDSDLAEPQMKAAKLIRQSAETLLHLLNDILEFSKSEAGKLEIETYAFDLPELLRQTVELVSPLASAKSLTLRLCVDPALKPHVRGDAIRIKQVVQNLLSNAIKFTDKGGVEIKVAHIGMRPDGQQDIRIDVVDTGIGISSEQLAQLFSAFVQADSSITRRFGGTGLGLAISKALIERMGGTIGAASELGKGTTMSIVLPMATAEAHEISKRAEDEQASLEKAIARLRSRPVKPSILVAEDNPTNQIVIRAALGNLGVSAEIVGDGLEAVDALERKSYDVVLMDISMPRLDGLSATRRIRSLASASAAVPIIALTANVLESSIRECTDAGMNGFVSKPFRKHDLAVALVQALDGQSSLNGAIAPAEPGTATICDYALLEQFAASEGDEVLRLLITTFLESAKKQLDTLQRISVYDSPLEEAVRIAHSLKSASAMAGALALSEKAREMEAQLQNHGAAINLSSESSAMQELFDKYQTSVKQRFG